MLMDSTAPGADTLAGRHLERDETLDVAVRCRYSMFRSDGGEAPAIVAVTDRRVVVIANGLISGIVATLSPAGLRCSVQHSMFESYLELAGPSGYVMVSATPVEGDRIASAVDRLLASRRHQTDGS